MNTTWIPYDYDHPEANPRPPLDHWVWVYSDDKYGVTMAARPGYVHWIHVTGDDDLHVTHWAPVDPPEPPPSEYTPFQPTPFTTTPLPPGCTGECDIMNHPDEGCTCPHPD